MRLPPIPILGTTRLCQDVRLHGEYWRASGLTSTRSKGGKVPPHRHDLPTEDHMAIYIGWRESMVAFSGIRMWEPHEMRRQA